MFGFLSKGDMKLEIDGLNYRSGDTIKGKATLKLKKPQNAKGVFVAIVAEKKTTQYSSNGTSTRWETIFDFKQPLDSEKEYSTMPYEYEFEINVPDIQSGNAPDGFLGDLSKAASFLSGRSGAVKWYLIAKIDIPGGRDVSKKIQINVA